MSCVGGKRKCRQSKSNKQPRIEWDRIRVQIKRIKSVETWSEVREKNSGWRMDIDRHTHRGNRPPKKLNIRNVEYIKKEVIHFTKLATIEHRGL